MDNVAWVRQLGQDSRTVQPVQHRWVRTGHPGPVTGKGQSRIVAKILAKTFKTKILVNIPRLI
jgi:hypothetical protein